MKDELLETLKATPPEQLEAKLWEVRHRIHHEWFIPLADSFNQTSGEPLETVYQPAYLYLQIARFMAKTFSDDFYRAWQYYYESVIANVFDKQKGVALASLANALQLFEKYPQQEHLGVAYSYEGLAQLYREKGAYTEAVVYYKKAIEVYQVLQRPFDVVSNQRSLGSCWVAKGNYSEAIDCFQKVATYFQRLPLFRLEGTTFDTQILRQGFEAHQISFPQNGVIFEVQDSSFLVTDLENEGIYLVERETDSLSVSFHSGNSLLEYTKGWDEIGQAYASQGLYQKAIQYFRSAVDYIEQNDLYSILERHPEIYKWASGLVGLKSSPLVQKCLYVRFQSVVNLAHVYIQINQLRTAHERLAYAKYLAKQLSKEFVGRKHEMASLHLHFASLHHKGGDLERAEKQVNKALELCRQGTADNRLVATCHNNLGVIALAKAQNATEETSRRSFRESAIASLNQALSLWNNTLDLYAIASAHAMIGLAYLELRESHQAKAAYEKALPIFQEGGQTTHPELVWVILHGLGKVYERMKDYAQAASKYEEAMGLIEETRQGITDDTLRLFFMDDKMVVYRDLIALKIRGGTPEAALKLIERSKSRTLLELMQKRTTHSVE